MPPSCDERRFVSQFRGVLSRSKVKSKISELKKSGRCAKRNNALRKTRLSRSGVLFRTQVERQAA